MIRCAFLILIVSLVVVPGSTSANPWPSDEPVTIGIVRDDDSESMTAVTLLMQAEITDLLAGEYEARFAPRWILDDNETLAAARASIRALLADPEVDLIVCVGYVSSTGACHYGEPFAKPVLAPFALDAALQGLEPVDGGSGIANLHYLAADAVAQASYEALSQLLTVQRVALLAPSAMAEVNPDYRAAVLTRVPALEDVVMIPLTEDVDTAVAAIPADVDAVVALTETLTRAEVARLAELLLARRLPSYSYLGHQDVALGFLTGMISPKKVERLVRRTALTVQRILLGDDPARIPVAFSLESRLGINMRTARALGISPPWDLRLEAELVADEPDLDVPRIDLSGAVDLALTANRDLAAERQAVVAGRAQVDQAGSALLPQVEVGARGTIIDEDRAEASFGSQAERTYSANVEATQLVFADRAWAGLSIQQLLQRGREANLRTRELDVTLDVTLAYLNVLRANTVEDIRRENLRLTQSNLELARQRNDIGVAGPAEVYRWEAEVAQRRQELITANSRRNLAEIELNRLLHRGLEDPLVLADIDLDDPLLVLDGAWLAANLPNARTFKRFRDWVVQEALANAPELAAVDASLAAQERQLTATGRAMWLPQVYLAGSYERILDRQGAGADGGLSVPGFDLPGPPDDDNWSVTLGASLPLFEGGRLRADRRLARAGLAQLDHEREAAAERVAQAARSAFHTAGATFANIRHARAGAEAARKTLEVVTDAYARGAADLLALLDAQNAALVAHLVAANAEYDFLSDSMRTQRALGRFDTEFTPEQRAAERARIEAYLASE